MIHVFEFPATTDREADHAIAFIHLWAAFKLAPALGGIRLADNNDDLLSATEVNDAFKGLLVDPAAKSPAMIPQGGVFPLSDSALALLKKCWSRIDRQGDPVGLRAVLGTNVEVIGMVENFLGSVARMTPDEYAEYKQPEKLNDE